MNKIVLYLRRLYEGPPFCNTQVHTTTGKVVCLRYWLWERVLRMSEGEQ